MWMMLQQKNPSDYVISTGKQYTVKKFVNLVLEELKINYKWKGKNLKEKCFANKKCIIETDKAYYRPLEVDSLLGDSRKARRELNWKPKNDIKKIVKDMVSEELNHISND